MAKAKTTTKASKVVESASITEVLATKAFKDYAAKYPERKITPGIWTPKGSDDAIPFVEAKLHGFDKGKLFITQIRAFEIIEALPEVFAIALGKAPKVKAPKVSKKVLAACETLGLTVAEYEKLNKK